MIIFCYTSLVHAKQPFGGILTEQQYYSLIPYNSLMQFINQYQQTFYISLRNALKALKENNWLLIYPVGFSFLYGVLHAIGPGHGKAVISAHILANPIQLKSVIIISFLSAFVQGMNAIIVVNISYFLLRTSGINMMKIIAWMEIGSYFSIIIFGLWLLLRKLKFLYNNFRNQRTVLTSECTTCSHSHHHLNTTITHSKRLEIIQILITSITMGMRPCVGALQVLTFSLLNQIYTAGILSVFAISLGTAITVSAIAILAFFSKQSTFILKKTEKVMAIQIIAHILGIIIPMLLIVSGLFILNVAMRASF
ncbi:nickel/cobalt transporter [Liberibacter crescens]|uniref:nickel/cobalt transporter n=1 Tax=Liberibacter crescens TaxID=1273132 RepID=UPI00155F4D40|nr:nickel/cobalt transporter [Liberibacter crescens]